MWYPSLSIATLCQYWTVDPPPPLLSSLLSYGRKHWVTWASVCVCARTSSVSISPLPLPLHPPPLTLSLSSPALPSLSTLSSRSLEWRDVHSLLCALGRVPFTPSPSPPSHRQYQRERERKKEKKEGIIDWLDWIREDKGCIPVTVDDAVPPSLPLIMMLPVPPSFIIPNDHSPSLQTRGVNWWSGVAGIESTSSMMGARQSTSLPPSDHNYAMNNREMAAHAG